MSVKLSPPNVTQDTFFTGNSRCSSACPSALIFTRRDMQLVGPRQVMLLEHVARCVLFNTERSACQHPRPRKTAKIADKLQHVALQTDVSYGAIYASFLGEFLLGFATFCP